MAHPEHLEILKQGVERWNQWREENPAVPVDLRRAELRDLNLRGRAGARANLSGADLSGAALFHANLVGADLSDANLSHANLHFTNLTLAGLGGAILRGVFLANTNLSHAYLENTDLTSARFSHTILGGTRFIDVIGLESCIHEYPSNIDFQTLRESSRFPLSFLRGCGLPDVLIDYLPSLLNDPLQFYSCFISYSSKDQDFAERLHADLQNKGVRCWFASEDLKIGDRFRDRIDESIRLHDKLLLILSEKSVSSQWVGDEVEAAFERERKENRTVLFPIQIDETVTESTTGWAAAIRRTRHIGDFREWKDQDSYQKAFDRLLRGLRAGT
jgi:uncharacterized protein YjbI with pentapeptide repeats